MIRENWFFSWNWSSKNNIFNNPIPAPAEDFDKNKFGSGYIGKVKNSGIINVYGTANTAMKLYIDGPGGIAAEKKLKYNANVITNAGIINLYGTRNLGMYASDGGDADVMGPPPDYKFTRFFTMSRVTNKGTINVNGAGNVAMSAGSAIVLNQAINLEDGTINLKGKNNIGMWTFFVISEGDNFLEAIKINIILDLEIL